MYLAKPREQHILITFFIQVTMNVVDDDNFHLDTWSQYLVDEVKTQSEQYENNKKKSSDTTTPSKYNDEMEYNKESSLDRIAKLNRNVWENIPTVISESIQDVVKQLQDLKSEVSTLNDKLKIKEKKIEILEEERNFFLSETRESLISLENKVNTKPSISFVNACLNTKANKSDIYAMISPPPPIDPEELNARLENIEGQHQKLVNKIATDNKCFPSIEMLNDVIHEVNLVRKAVADNTLDDQTRYQNYEEKLKKLADREKKTLDGLTHLSSAMKAINKKIRAKHLDSNDEVGIENDLKTKIKAIVEKLWKKKKGSIRTIEKAKEEDSSDDENQREERMVKLIKKRIMTDTKFYISEQITKEQKIWESTKDEVEKLRKDLNHVQKVSRNTIQQFEEMEKEFKEEKVAACKTKSSIHHVNEELRLEIQKLDGKITSEISKSSAEIQKVNNRARNIPSQIATLHELHSSSEKLLIDLSKRLDTSSKSFEKTVEQIRRGVYTVTRKMNTAIKKDECVQIIQNMLKPKFEFLDKKIVSQKKSLAKYAKKVDLKKINKRFNTTVQETDVDTAAGQLGKFDVVKADDTIADKTNAVNKKIIDLQHKFEKHTELNELEIRKLETEISNLKEKFKETIANNHKEKQRFQKTNSNKSKNVFAMYNNRSAVIVDRNDNNMAQQRAIQQQYEQNLQQQLHQKKQQILFIEDDGSSLVSDDDVTGINADQNIISEKQLEQRENTIDIHHQRETDLILHSLKSHKDILEQRLRELSYET
eukprot:g205.t1